MNGFERIMTAMRLGQPDRVPISEFLIDRKVYRHFFPDAESQMELEIAWDMDAVGCGAEFFVTEEINKNEFVDEWGVRYKRNEEHVAHPVKGCIFNREDLKKYTPPDPEHPGRLGRLPELVSRFKGGKAIIFRHRAAFMWSCYLMGMDEMLMNFILEPQLCHDLMDLVLDANIRVVRRAVRAGADIVVLGDDYAHNSGPMMSPEVFAEFILPRLQKMVDAIHEEGAMVIKHTDGNIMKIIEPIINTGIDGLNPLEPTAGMDIGVIKRLYGDRVCLWGNIDCGDLLSHGTRDQVEQAVIKCIKDAGNGGGFVLSSSNSIHSSVNPWNFRAMVEAGKKYGEY
ncbi:MAG: hypothetical protein JXB33_07050 [Clostridia bacterium]|nr:hypothetical protein [Clostridia bacterium]